jgi:hypothetical protein
MVLWPEPLVSRVQFAKGVVIGAAPFFMGSEPLGMWLYRAYGVPWKKSDINERFKSLTRAEFEALNGAFRRGGGLPRWNGSLYYPAKVPDLIGIKNRKYIDHTATHLHRGVGDLMRYAALVSFAETADFGPYHMLDSAARRVQARLPDEASMHWRCTFTHSNRRIRTHSRRRRNPDRRSSYGRGCSACHRPPLYTSNKLTLAKLSRHRRRSRPRSISCRSLWAQTREWRWRRARELAITRFPH